jgi:hypothetical protein
MPDIPASPPLPPGWPGREALMRPNPIKIL